RWRRILGSLMALGAAGYLPGRVKDCAESGTPGTRARGSGKVEAQCRAVDLGTHPGVWNPALIAGQNSRISDALFIADESSVATPQQPVRTDVCHQFTGNRLRQRFQIAIGIVTPGGGAGKTEAPGKLD